jgi:hypothetical protein
MKIIELLLDPHEQIIHFGIGGNVSRKSCYEKLFKNNKDGEGCK